MGQKIHPTGFRLSVSRNWASRWYASNRDFAGMLAEDIEVRDYLKGKLKNAAVSRVLIERPAKTSRRNSPAVWACPSLSTSKKCASPRSMPS